MRLSCSRTYDASFDGPNVIYLNEDGEVQLWPEAPEGYELSRPAYDSMRQEIIWIAQKTSEAEDGEVIKAWLLEGV